MENLSVGVLISGSGTTLQNLLHRHAMGDLPAEFKVVISSNPKAKGLDIATAAGIPTANVARKDFANAAAHSQAVFDLLRKHQVQLVVMGGYLEHVLIPEDFTNRVINIHPSLIPAFCGKGFYGLRVHQSVLNFGAKISGCTVHFVDNEFDHGPIIAQRACPVLWEDTPESLKSRVFEIECQLYPDTISAIARKHVCVQGRTVVVDEII